jgi:outer membrane protein OmpA-like peptidoglycan-associated protein
MLVHERLWGIVMAWLRRTSGLVACAVLSASFLGGCTHPRKEAMQLLIPEKCGELTFPVYFNSYRAGLTSPARQLIHDAGRANRDCKVTRVDVIGLADYRGTPRQNLDLSRKRALAVAEALADAGLPEPSFGVVAAGESGAIGPGGKPEILRRRADVTIHYQPAG